jgi:glycosyltransferase involved in cell wall biosynthesis
VPALDHWRSCPVRRRAGLPRESNCSVAGSCGHVQGRKNVMIRHRSAKVLHVLATVGQGGVETWLSNLLVRLNRSKVQSDICFYRRTDSELCDRFKDAGCGLFEIPLVETPAGLINFSRRFLDLLRRRRYDVVHCHGMSFIGLLIMLARIAGVPVRIAHSHGSQEPERLAALRAFLELCRLSANVFATHRIGCSTEAAEALFGQGCCARGANVVYCGIELPAHARDVEAIDRDVLGIPRDSLMVGCVANFTPAKNHLFLLDVFAEIVRRRPDAHLVLVGDGSLRPAISHKIAERGLEARVHMLGRRSDVARLLRAFDVFVLPSITEGLPVALLEAQAFGVPCVTSTAVTPESAVAPGLVSFVPLDDGLDAWVEAVFRSAGHSSCNARLPNTNWEDRFRGSAFDIDVCAARLMALYAVDAK